MHVAVLLLREVVYKQYVDLIVAVILNLLIYKYLESISSYSYHYYNCTW